MDSHGAGPSFACSNINLLSENKDVKENIAWKNRTDLTVNLLPVSAAPIRAFLIWSGLNPGLNCARRSTLTSKSCLREPASKQFRYLDAVGRGKTLKGR